MALQSSKAMSSILSSRNMADEDLEEIMGGKHYDFDGDLSDAIKADLGSGRDEAFALPSAVEDEESESEEEEVENDSEEEEEDGEETYDNEFDTDNEGTCTTLLFAFAFTFVFQWGSKCTWNFGRSHLTKQRTNLPKHTFLFCHCSWYGTTPHGHIRLCCCLWHRRGCGGRRRRRRRRRYVLVGFSP